MQQRVKSKKHNNRLNLLGAIGKYCFVIAFSISFLGQAALFFNQSQCNKSGEHKSLLRDGAHHDLNLALRFSFCIEPDGNEADNDDDAAADHSEALWFKKVVPGNGFVYSIEKTSFSNFTSCIENRKPVSLIILYHSWKSFIS